MNIADDIREKLQIAFQPDFLDVRDESELHRGHAGYREGGQSHFRVKMRAASLMHMDRLSRHRAIYRTLGSDLMGRLHALALDLDG